MDDAEFLQNLSETELLTNVIAPLLSRMGYTQIRHVHGPAECGKDIVFCREDPLAGTLLFSITLKKAKLSGKIRSSSSLLAVYNQLLQALQQPLINPLTGYRVSVNRAYLVTPYQIPQNALDAIGQAFQHDSHRVRIIDGPSLVGLINKYLPMSLSAVTDSAAAHVVPLERLFGENILPKIRDRFLLLLSDDPEEQKVQTFLEDNSILFHQFSPKVILRKAPILAKHETDFAILSENGDLHLIEIERPGKRILRKDGGRTALLTQAFDQVHDWLNVVREHRIGVIECLGDKITNEQVGSIRGMVIMGRDEGYNAESLQKLKSTDFGEASFLTFDDLARSLDSLIRHLKAL
jgi:hypothetical protein